MLIEINVDDYGLNSISINPDNINYIRDYISGTCEVIFKGNETKIIQLSRNEVTAIINRELGE